MRHHADGDPADGDPPAAAPVPVLSMQQVAHRYPANGRHAAPLEVLKPITLDIHAGECICLVGPSGCGKTTVLRLMAGFLHPSEGTVLDEGEAVEQPDSRRGMVFQHPHLYPWLTVEENITFGPRVRGVPPPRRRELAQRYLEMVRLTEFAGARTWELSGGMQQRVALARVLANEPHILLMDEPFGALDALTREHLQDELLAIWRATGTTIVLVTHSVEEAVYLGTRILVFSPRPARVLADLEVPFSRNGAASGEPREVKAQREFIEMREEVLRYIWTSE